MLIYELDEAWRIRKVLTDDLVLPKEYPVIYVSATGSRRGLVATDGSYDVRMEVEIIAENVYREPSDETGSKRELTRLCRRIEEVLRRYRTHEPYWSRSVFHETEEPLRLELYHLRPAQHVVVGGVLLWHGYRRVTLT